MDFYKKTLVPGIFALSMTACIDKDKSNKGVGSINARIRIPVVFHVVYSESISESNISDEKIKSQITALNETFQGRNIDLNKVPSSYANLVADVGLEFYLAGIERSQEDLDKKKATAGERDKPLTFMKKNDWGGLDAWSSESYLNVWVVDLNDDDGELAILGQSTFPGEESVFDGLILDYRAVGTVAPLLPSYELGRTATHEIGHWLGLYHLSEQQGTCASWDCVEDTPQTMGVNFMESKSDSSILMFTAGQKARIQEQFTSEGARSTFNERSE